MKRTGERPIGRRGVLRAALLIGVACCVLVAGLVCWTVFGRGSSPQSEKPPRIATTTTMSPPSTSVPALTWSAPWGMKFLVDNTVVTGGTDPTIGNVSCPSVHLCVATADGQVLYSTDPTGGPSKWVDVQIKSARGIGEIACPSVQFCLASTGYGVLSSTDPTGPARDWHYTRIAYQTDLATVQCPSPHLCALKGGSGTQFVASEDPAGAMASDWHVTTSPTGLWGVFSCPTSTRCYAAGSTFTPTKGTDSGFIYETTDPGAAHPTWSQGSLAVGFPKLSEGSNYERPDDGWAQFTCRTVTFCVATDADLTELYVSTAPMGGTSHWTSSPIGHLTLSGITCLSKDLCLSLGDYTTDLSGGPTTWRPIAAEGRPPGAFSCPTTTECIGVKEQGFEVLHLR